MRVLLATTNPGKIAELRQLLGEQRVDIVGLSDSASTEELESGTTFEENALLKARHFFGQSGIATIADDSGLEVEALRGAPGVFSARYAGAGASDADRISRLLDEMKNVPEELRNARFVCAAAVVWERGEKVFVCEARGSILTLPRGSNGFGYDPVFLYHPLGRSFAELTSSEKADVSHRGRAFRHLATWLSESGVLDSPKSGDRIVSTAD